MTQPPDLRSDQLEPVSLDSPVDPSFLGYTPASWLKLIEEGLLDTDKLDHLLCHYSSHHFKSRIYDLLDMAGARVDEEKWYSNLYTRGNTGSASILIMLDEFLTTGRAKPGDTIICMVPESGRFNVAYIHLTVVEEGNE